MNKAAQAYRRQFGIALITYIIVLIGSITILNQVAATIWRIPLVLAPVISVVFGLLAFLRFLDQMDELQQRLQLSAIAFACGSTGMLTFTYGFLEGIGFPRLSWIYVFPLMIALWGIGLATANRRYR